MSEELANMLRNHSAVVRQSVENTLITFLLYNHYITKLNKAKIQLPVGSVYITTGIIIHFAWDKKADANGVDRRRNIKEKAKTQQGEKDELKRKV